jgi:hypothetical protein
MRTCLGMAPGCRISGILQHETPYPIHEALELAPPTLQADHLRFFTSNHSRPVAATISTTMMLHGVDDVGSSLGVEP